MCNDTKLSFVSEVGTFGSMSIKDPTVVEAELEAVSESNSLDDIRSKALKKYLNDNKARKGGNDEF